MAAVRTYRITNQVWQYYLYVLISGTQDQSRDWACKKFNCEPKALQGPTGTMFWREGQKDHLIWLANPPTAGIVAHEAFHSVMHVLPLLGLGQPNSTNDEAYAYLLQWTVNQIMIRG